MSWEGALVDPWSWVVGLLPEEEETAEGSKEAGCWINDDEKKDNGAGVVVVEAVGWDCSEKEGAEEDWVR